MLNSTSSQLLSLREAAQLLPGRPHIATLHRWRLRGVKGIKLKTIKVGGRRFVSRESLEEFIAQTTEAADGESASTSTMNQQGRSTGQAEAAQRRCSAPSTNRVDAELDAAGI